MTDNNRSCWELIASGSLAHEPTIVQCLPDNDNTYGKEYVFDQVPPAETWTFNAQGLTRDERNALRTAAKTRNAVITLTANTGENYKGRITAVSWESQEGTEHFTASLTLRSCANEVSTAPAVQLTWGKLETEATVTE